MKSNGLRTCTCGLFVPARPTGLASVASQSHPIQTGVSGTADIMIQDRTLKDTATTIGRAEEIQKNGTLGDSIDINLLSFNCQSFKASSGMILNELKRNCDVAFLSETWLRPGEIAPVERDLKSMDLWADLKSSMTTELHMGRPFGGVGFLCKKRKDISYKPIHIENERIAGLEILYKGKNMLTVLGVYLPYYNGAAEQISLYSETLDEVHGLLESCCSPCVIAGDMNATLPMKRLLSRKWYKRHPFNDHSMLLYDFIMDNQLAVLDFEYEQTALYTYANSANRSHIDHVICTERTRKLITNCSIKHNNEENVSDHLPLLTGITLPVDLEQLHDSPGNPVSRYPRINWSKPCMRDSYRTHVQESLKVIKRIDVDAVSEDNALTCLNRLCTELTDAMHGAARAVSENDKRSRTPTRPRKHWWDEDCRITRDRHRFWFFIWKSCGRPRTGHVYGCHKEAKKEYRRACRRSINTSMHQHYRAIDALFSSGNARKFWNGISSMKSKSKSSTDDVKLSDLWSYYENKFSPGEALNISSLKEAETYVTEKRAEACEASLDRIGPSQIGSIIRSLKTRCSPGVDGILTEHLRYASSRDLHLLIADMTNACIKFHVVPDSFTEGVLIPILKKPHLDTSQPKNYRPITISTTFAKLLEKFILIQCKDHEFHNLQFGFVEGLGTDIAATLAHDVISHCNFEGSTVYVCSLDAEGAFDCIPHPILFRHCHGIIPDPLWLLLVEWYARLSVCIRWGNYSSEPIRVLQGTRQGGLSSPFLFNTFYGNLINTLSNMDCGISIGGVKYNVFCYADDILIASLSTTGLEKLLIAAHEIIVSQGLKFNPTKSVCTVFGKCPLTKKPHWELEGVQLKEDTLLQYLGVTISSDGKSHADARINKCNRAYYALQGSGLRPRALAPYTMKHLWDAAVKPVLLYGAHCTYLRKTALERMQKTQTKLLKQSLGLKQSCHNTELMKALDVSNIMDCVSISRIHTLKSALSSNSRANDFYAYVLCCTRNGAPVDPRGSVAQVRKYCEDHEIALLDTVLPENPSVRFRPTDCDEPPNGLHDSIRQLLSFYSESNRELLNSLICAF